MNVLVIDIGGTHVKMTSSNGSDPRRFDSGQRLTPQRLIDQVRRQTADWSYDVVALGYPGSVDSNGPTSEPGNLDTGWVGFDFQQAFGKPVRIVNDAVMQALGGYDGGRMLFLGLGTGLGSALVTERVVVPLELGCLMYAPGETIGERLGRAGLERHGKPAWLRTINEVTHVLRDAFAADYIVLGGGNAGQIETLPAGTRRGGNDDAFRGGFRIWEEVVEPHDQHPGFVWRVVR
jgi:polyphosphate glucokinase